MPDNWELDEARRLAASDAAASFAKSCRGVEEHTPAAEPTSLAWMVNDLMTELWDSGFSTAEIRSAFEAAAKDVDRYARSDERSGSGIRGTALR